MLALLAPLYRSSNSNHLTMDPDNDNKRETRRRLPDFRNILQPVRLRRFIRPDGAAHWLLLGRFALFLPSVRQLFRSLVVAKQKKKVK